MANLTTEAVQLAYENHLKNVAVRRLPDGFEIYSWERVGGRRDDPKSWNASKLKAAPCNAKGKLDTKKRVELYVTDEEVRAEEARYERETGRCHECSGHGQELAGWSAETGRRYRACRRCDGTGQPKKGGV